jgi:hypothetical protein
MWRDAIPAVLARDYWRLDTRVAGASSSSSSSSSRCDYPPEKGEWSTSVALGTREGGETSL